MAHTDACKIQACQLLDKFKQGGLSLRGAAKKVQVESDGIPAKTLLRWWYDIRNEVEEEEKPKRLKNETPNINNLKESKSESHQGDGDKPKQEQPKTSPPEEQPKPDTIPKRYISVFNETNDNIDWARWSWNPVTGCLHDCKYCYARDIANRFYKQKFKPTFHPNRLEAPVNTQVPEQTNGRDRNVFVCSMADLFGEWIKQEWIDRTIDAVRSNPQWNFIFLTKNPERMIDIEWPSNSKVGTTVDVQARVEGAESAFQKIKAPVKFLSVEPMLEDLIFSDLEIFDCVIIGGQSKSSRCPEFQPKREWVTNLLIQAEDAQVKRIFLKPNLTVYRQFP